MAAGLPLEVEDESPLAGVLAAVERWRLAEGALQTARHPEEMTTGSASPAFGAALAVGTAAWVQAFGCAWGLWGAAVVFGAVAGAFLAWWYPRLLAHRRALAAAEKEHAAALAAVADATRRLFGEPFEITRGSIRYLFRP
ncbi:MAG: hypothetical protein ACOZNI_05455 [Myxococcota bacterium]